MDNGIQGFLLGCGLPCESILTAGERSFVPAWQTHAGMWLMKAVVWGWMAPALSGMDVDQLVLPSSGPFIQGMATALLAAGAG